MAFGPGKYDDLCTAARASTEAAAVILIVLAGNKGHGFSCQTVAGDITDKLPAMLRNVADIIEKNGNE